jgi:hypothetical protein
MMMGAGRCCNNQCYAQSDISFAAFADFFLLNCGDELEMNMFLASLDFVIGIANKCRWGANSSLEL